MNVRLVIALAAYAALGVIGAFALSGQIRLALWIFLGGLAAKTAIAIARAKAEEREGGE